MRSSPLPLLLVLALGSLSSPALASYNLISNGSFDDGLTSWTQSGNWTNYDFVTSTKELALGNYEWQGVAGVTQVLPTQSGKQYAVVLGAGHRQRPADRAGLQPLRLQLCGQYLGHQRGAGAGKLRHAD